MFSCIVIREDQWLSSGWPGVAYRMREMYFSFCNFGTVSESRSDNMCVEINAQKIRFPSGMHDVKDIYKWE